MNYNKNYIQNCIALLIMFSGIIALIMVWYLQHVLNMAPCSLCLLERWPYRVLIGIGLIGLFVPRRYFFIVLWASIGVLLISLGLSFLHIGVEQTWWRSPFPECNATLVHTDSLIDRLNSLPDRPNKPCDAPSYLFSWLPLSLTMLNGLYSLFFFVILIWQLIRENRNYRIYF